MPAAAVTSPPARRAARRRAVGRGITLRVGMIALASLAARLVILIETQPTAAAATREAERILVATQLAHEKLAEVRMLVEREGFQTQDVHEEGDFDDFGDDALNLEFKELSDFHYEFLITEIDLGLASDLNGAMQKLSGLAGAAGEGNAAPPIDLSGLPIPLEGDMIVQMLEPFVREVRVRVWWGDDLRDAEENGDEVVLTTHMINPQGNMLGAAGLGGPGGGGGQGLPGRQSTPTAPTSPGRGGAIR